LRPASVVRARLLACLFLAACGSGSRDLAPRLVQIDGGNRHTCGVERDGRAWCWGEGDRGQLGAGDSVSSQIPVAVAGGTRFAAVSAGYGRTCGVDRDGRAWCWGEHAAPPAAPGLKALTETTRAEPALVEGGPALVSIVAGGFHACGLDAEGSAWCWGSNVYGELGTGTHEQSFAPAPVAGPRFTVLAAGNTHACGLDESGAAWCWGDNQFGQLGDGTHDWSRAPVAVAGGLRFRGLSAGTHHTCGLAPDGRAHCWGMSADHQTGGPARDVCGPNPCAIAPVAVAGDLRFRSIEAGPRHTCGVTDAREAWCWGEHWTDGSGDAAETPERANDGGGIAAIAASASETCGITRLGETRCFGRPPDPLRTYGTLAIVGGFLIAALVMAWERRLISTTIFLIPMSALVAGWIALMIPLLHFWNELRKDETGWFFIMELFALALIFCMIAALGGLLAMVARAWTRRQTI
jgi:hypothetical protein